MSKADRAPEPTLEQILTTISQLSAGIKQAESDLVLTFDPCESAKSSGDATHVEKAISASKNVSPPNAKPSNTKTAPELLRGETVSYPGECAPGPSKKGKYRPKRLSRHREFQGMGRDISDASAVASISEIDLNDAAEAVRPFLRSWLNENMARVFAKALREEFKETGMLPWKARQHRNRWRRWFRHSH
jgi:cell pole-organizing protein PopZ